MGTIFDIMKYSIHDGPGIRTTVFFKGCPLNCWWCHNPESQAIGQEIMLWEDRCIGCGDCLKACRNGAIVNRDGVLLTVRENCRMCFECVKVCHSGARVAVGKNVTPEQVMEEVQKDIVFYEESGGGVTFSGGEPLLQPDFLEVLLGKCKEKEIHTAVDTTGFAKSEDLLRTAPKTDLFLYDLKLMDELEHRKYTGVSNEPILKNLSALSRCHGNIIIRIPVIPGVNDGEENLMRTAGFVSGLNGVREIDLLPYHKAGAGKYQRLEMTYALPETEPPDNESVNRMAEKMRISGKKIKIGG
mgnify:CR=1 FL=1